MAGRSAFAHNATRTMLPAMASAVTQVNGPASTTIPTISATSSTANPANPATPERTQTRYRRPSAATASNPMQEARTRPIASSAGHGPGLIRLVTRAAIQQPPTTGPSPSSRRAARRAGFTRAKSARISAAEPNSCTAASAAVSRERPRDR